MGVNVSGWFKKAYWGLVQGENFLGHVLVLILRLYWGGLLIVSGWVKFMNADQVADFFSSLNIPYPVASAYIVAAVEFFGGISLFIGFLTRFFTVLLAAMLFTAYGTAHYDAFMNFFSNPSQFIQQPPFLYLLVSLIVLGFGPGLFSIDYWLEKRAFGRSLS